jgi:thioredoxin 2
MEFTYSVCKSCKGLNKVSLEKALATKPVCGKCGTTLPMHGMVSEVDTEGFQKILRKSELPVAVDFWASWCGPCKVYGPEFEKASLEKKGTVFLKISTETEQQLSAQYGIRGIPCTVLFKDGKEVRRQAGAMEKAGVLKFIG